MTSLKIIAAKPGQHLESIRDIFWEYLQWANSRVVEEYGFGFDIAAILESDMSGLEKFMPPEGRLLLGFAGEFPAGVACLKPLHGSYGEVKRMYVRPQYRHAGLGRELLNGLLVEAAKIGYTRLRLDSACFMTDAHRLYRSLGFVEIKAYEGSEIPVEYQSQWVFMEKILAPEAAVPARMDHEKVE